MIDRNQLGQVLEHINRTPNVIDTNLYNYLIQVAREHYMYLQFNAPGLYETEVRDSDIVMLEQTC